MGLFSLFSKKSAKPEPSAARSARQEEPRARHAPAEPFAKEHKRQTAAMVPPKTAPRPAVPPVGARGETDLAPSRVNLDQVTYPSVEGSSEDVDRAALRDLFTDIASGQAAPVRSFVGDLRAGTATGEWLQICRPIMANLLESATSLGLDEAARPMSEFLCAMDLAAERRAGKDGPIDAAARDILVEAYGALMEAFPGAFALDETASRRDTMLLHALLKQVRGVGTVTFDALYGVGLTSVEALSQASPGDLSSTTGIAVPLCEAICAGLREHRLDLERNAHLPAERRFAERLNELLHALVKEHDAFLRLDGEAGFDEARAERKRAARRNRDLRALKIDATLIEMGEVDRADAWRVLSFDRRIEHLGTFLGVRVAKRATERPQR
jgi:hypothetical protein